MNKPAMLVVDDDPQVLAAVRRDLRGRYREDYVIVSAPSGEEALKTIRELKARGDALAIVISDQRMPGMQGTDLLAQTLELYPQARRVLLTAYSDIDAAIKAINVAHLDHYLSKPWTPPEELLYPVIDDLLDGWQADYLPEAKGLRLVGHQWSPRSHQIKDFLAGNLIPYRWLDADRDTDAATLLEAAGFSPVDLPALFFEDGSSLSNPEPRQVAERLGRPLSVSSELYDLVIAGAGPAGLAAAVYGASEGLRTLLLDRHSPGGQAGSSSRIENYLGFPAGVSGSELTRRAVTQAQRLGAEMVVPLEVCSVSIDPGGYKRLCLSDGRQIVTRTLLAATGMEYREHSAPGVAELTGAGVYYGAAVTEAPSFRDRRVLVVGGGNSAGQAALYLARYAKEVDIAVRRESLRATMSHYLIEQIAKAANVCLRPLTELAGVAGDGHVERVTLRLGDNEVTESMDAVFVFIGTRPRTAWLPEGVLRDEKGFVVTGRDLLSDERFARVWKERREPMALESSVPGLFAAGDVRAGAMNRVASAVGEGSMTVRLAHEYLAMT